jgi:very-short-patch-repair endonuclease
MMVAYPSSHPSGHLLPQGEKEMKISEKSPSPLEGEGGSRRLTVEGFAQQQSKRLRKDMTDVERILWSALRARRYEKFKFRRQVPIGKYIVDFVCFERSLIVELDGIQHQDSIHDEVRDAWLTTQGFRVLRYWNIDILQALDGTLRSIFDALNMKSTNPSSGAARHLLPQGEKGSFK